MATIEEKRLETLLFLRRVFGTDIKEVAEKDSKKLLSEFKNLEPVFVCVNHTTVIKCFKIKNKLYRVYYNLFEHVVIDEIVT